MKLRIKYGRYSCGDALAITMECENGEPYCKLSVNVEGISEHLEHDEFVMKDYSENERVAKALLAAGTFIDTKEKVPVGRCECPIMRVPKSRPMHFEF